ncbi:hypothetical protein I4U23_011442 [Adineta vaga]|nr:hypothetical protein I4U23_011442 [Adineta vaga]
MFSKENEQNSFRKRSGILATRFYLLLLCISLIILSLFNTFTAQAELIQISYPSFDQFTYLNDRYSSNIRCSCKNISVPYISFMSLEPQLHYICTNQLLNNAAQQLNDRLSFALLSSLNNLCQLANRTLNNSLIDFLSTQYVSSQLTQPILFQSQVKVFIHEMLTLTTNTFIRKIKETNTYIHSNQLLSALMTNYDLQVKDEFNGQRISTVRRTYQNGLCDCQLNDTCSEESSIISGFRIGCYITDAVLQSNLQCFYNQTCMMTTFNLTEILSIEDMNYSTSMTIDQLMNDIFITKWIKQEANYEKYFIACRPMLCIYSPAEKRNYWLVVTVTIAIMGGLSKILKIVVPFVVKIVRKIILYRKNYTVQPNNS